MARTIVNKHFDDSAKITREQFHEEEQYAKGEIIIFNDDDNPSIYVLDKNGNPKQITGGGSGGGIDEKVLNEFKEEITKEYTAADNIIKNGYVNADNALRNELIGANDDFKSDVSRRLGNIEKAFTDADTTITQSIIDTKNEVLSHTINGIKIENDPVLDATNITVGKYSEMVLDNVHKEQVVSNDTAQVAIKKVENMLFANALAFSAGLNDVNRKAESFDVSEDVLSENNILHLKPNTLHLLQGNVENIVIEIDEVNKEYMLQLTTGNVFDATLPDNIIYSTKNPSELEANTTYLFKFVYNYVDIIKLHLLNG
jgi:hypothetical protein